MAKERIAIMTCGGDAPGLNSFLTSCAKTLMLDGYEIIGVKNGFEGLIKKEILTINHERLTLFHQAGTVLGTSSRLDLHGHEKEFLKAFQELNCKGLIVSGGDGSFAALQAVHGKIPLIGVPKTIDNDLNGSDQSIGFDTAVTSVVETIDMLRTTADSLRRNFVVETMGRHAGWIALASGLTSYADAILIPERPFQRDTLKNFILNQKKQNLILVISEGATARGEKEMVSFSDPQSKEREKLGGIGQALSRWLQEETQKDFRHQVVGYLQRGHAPSQSDRMLALEIGIHAARLASSGQWHMGVAWNQGRIQIKEVSHFMSETRKVPPDHAWLAEAQTLGIYI